MLFDFLPSQTRAPALLQCDAFSCFIWIHRTHGIHHQSRLSLKMTILSKSQLKRVVLSNIWNYTKVKFHKHIKNQFEIKHFKFSTKEEKNCFWKESTLHATVIYILGLWPRRYLACCEMCTGCSDYNFRAWRNEMRHIYPCCLLQMAGVSPLPVEMFSLTIPSGVRHVQNIKLVFFFYFEGRIALWTQTVRQLTTRVKIMY